MNHMYTQAWTGKKTLIMEMIKIIIIVDVVVVSTKNFEWYAQSSEFEYTVRSSVWVYA